MGDDIREVFEEAELAVVQLCCSTPAMTPSFARAAIRIEVSAYEVPTLMDAMDREDMRVLMEPDYEGPLTKNGITIYIVPRLPAPGWRVVVPK